MKTTGNTILLTGGNSGIGRALAEALHALGNQVIITGRRKDVLDSVTRANPGMQSAVLDVRNAQAIATFANDIVERFPALNVLINNAGIMKPENLSDTPVALSDAEATVETNLLGPIRMTAALLPHLRKQSAATVINVSSGLAFLPLALTPTYSATKAALHSYTESLRLQLRKSNVEVLELIPPYVATELMGSRQANDPHAMPLGEFITEVMQLLRDTTETKEIRVKRVLPLRFAAEQGEAGYRKQLDGLNAAF
jgi:uncharacterized oxidoreductase